MKDRPSQPVIVGAGLSGMVISRALSKAGVPHLLLGDAPTPAPRLGESLSLDASLALLNFFPPGTHEGKRVAAENLSVTYRVEGDKIVELWTSRANYVFFFGEIIRYRVGLWLVYAYMLVWYLISGREALADRLANERLHKPAR